MSGAGLDYVTGLIAAYRAGLASDHMHLGYWPESGLDWRAAQDSLVSLHLDMLDLHDGLAVIDCGCGLGGTIRMIDTLIDDAVLIGINIDERQLSVCREVRSTVGNDLQWLAADATAIPLPDAVCDRLLSVEAMFHFPSRADFCAEALRLLRPGGIMVCSDILFADPQDTDEAAWLDLVRRDYAPWPDAVLTSAARDALIRSAGFEGVMTSDISAQVHPTWRNIVSARDTPLSSPQAAMRALHDAGRLSYVVTQARKPAT